MRRHLEADARWPLLGRMLRRANSRGREMIRPGGANYLRPSGLFDSRSGESMRSWRVVALSVALASGLGVPTSGERQVAPKVSATLLIGAWDLVIL
jgi:hypothetical protein